MRRKRLDSAALCGEGAGSGTAEVVVAALLRAGADPNARDNDGKLPSDYAKACTKEEAMKPTAPNLFCYATKALSQDAALAYILTWVKPEYREPHPRFHELGAHMRHALLASKIGEAAVPPVTPIDVETQSGRIDVLARISDENEDGLVLRGSGADRIVGAIRPGVRRGDAACAAMT